MDRHDRAGDRMDYEDAADDQFRETVNIMDMSLSRAPEPVGSNGEVWRTVHIVQTCEAYIP